VTLTSVFLSVNMVVIFLIYFRFIFGYFMRNFERQADGYVYTLFDTGRPLISTLEKIAYTSGQSPDRPNWHHFSISERIGHLVRCEADRGTIARHDLKVRNSILVFFGALVLVAAAGYSLNFGQTGKQLSSHFFEKIILREIEKHPQNPNLFKVLGDLYFETGNFKGVQQAYETALKLKPDSPQVLNNLAWLYATATDPQLRNPVRALELAQAAASLLTEPHILDTLAESYFVNGQYANALAAAQQALRLGAGAPQRLLRILDLVQDAPAAPQVVGTLGGQADPARGAVEQACAEVLLERRDVCARGGPRNVELVGRLRERAALGDPREDPHGEQLVHRSIIPKC